MPQSDPPSPFLSSGELPREKETPYGVWVADEGRLYPPAFHHRFPLTHLLLIHTPNARETWQVGLEAVQSGLFQWVLLRPSRECAEVFLRKLQLATEKTRCRVLLLCQQKLPHWLVKTTFEAEPENSASGLLMRKA